MEIVKAASELRNLLIAHDHTVQVIETLDCYINQKRRKLVCFDLDPYHSNTTLQISIATGVRQMYEHYRVSKMRQVQRLSQFIIATLSPEQAAQDEPTPHPQMSVAIDNDASQVTKNSLLWFRGD